MSRILRLLIVCLIFIQVICLPDLQGQGNLLITPKRVVFEGTRRSFDISLANIGQDTATYAISLIEIRMTEAGGFETIKEPDESQMFSSPYLRYFPRSVTLGPKETQTVKVQLVKTAGLAPGEYRSHFYFRAVQKEKPLGEDEPLPDPNSIAVKLTPVFGITIPVIIRVGQPTAEVSVSALELEMVNDTLPKLKFTFNRSGKYSVYGDISVDYVAPSGAVTRVGVANGVAVYTPNSRRKFELILSTPPGVDYTTGKLLLSFSAPSDLKPEKFTGAELLLK